MLVEGSLLYAKGDHRGSWGPKPLSAVPAS